MRYVVLIAVAGLVLVTAKWTFLPGRRLPRRRVLHLRARLLLRLHPGKGHANLIELWWRWGRLAVLRHARRSRPSLSLAARLLSPASSYSVLIGRAHYRRALRLPLDEHAVIFSPPRAGKTGWLGRVVAHYPGPVVSTTTKHDVFELTGGVRAAIGPVHVFNPQGVGDVPSTFWWNPLAGCQDPAVAIRRADAFATSVSQKGVEDASFWAGKASDYLRAYFHAAAIAGLDLRDVSRWVSGTCDDEPEAILLSAPGAGRHLAAQLAEMRGEANKTISTVRMTMNRLAVADTVQLPQRVQGGLPVRNDLRHYDFAQGGPCRSGGLTRRLPFGHLGDEPLDLRVLRPVADSRRVDRGDREAAGGDIREGPGQHAGFLLMLAATRARSTPADRGRNPRRASRARQGCRRR
jgi:Type IV secretory system Conjugative DNA transfer